MGERVVRLLVAGVGTAMAPLTLVLFFTWTRDGRLPGLVPLFGRGELVPYVASVAGQLLVVAHGMSRRDARWHAWVGVSCLMVLACCGCYVVPWSRTSGAGARVGAVSIVLLAVTIGVGVDMVRREQR